MNNSSQQGRFSLPAFSGRDFRLVGNELEGYRVLGHLQDHEDVVRRLPFHVDAIYLYHLKYGKVTCYMLNAITI